MVREASLAALLGAVLIGGGSLSTRDQPEPRNHVLATATTPITTEIQRGTWRLIVDDYLGVAGIDPVGHYIGSQAAYKTPGYANWFPLDGYKNILVGRFHTFEFCDLAGAEADWCNRIIPSGPTSFLLTDIVPIVTWPRSLYLFSCEGVDDCMEAEVTPDEHFYENDYFSAIDNSSRLVGKTIAAYGPWVRERIHGNRPEIHPSELLWWREDSKARNIYVLLLVQDDSNRYDRIEDFEDGVVHPWSAYPRTGEFRIAFELDPSAPPRRFFIYQWYSRNVVTSEDPAASRDVDDGKTHALEYNSRVVLTVEETQFEDDNIGVRFSEVTRNAEGTRLQGYIVITSKIGRGDRGDEGFHLLKVVEPTIALAQPALIVQLGPAPAPPPPMLRARALPQTLQAVVAAGKRRLVGDMVFEAPDLTPALTNSRVSFAAGAAAPRPLQLQPASPAERARGAVGVARAVPLLERGTFRVDTGSRRLTLGAPALTLTGFVSAGAPQAPRDGASAWPALQRTLGSPPAGNRPPGRLGALPRVALAAEPAYAAVRGGKPSPGEDSPFADELNRVLRTRDAGAMARIFGGDQPIADVKWSFRARNLISGQLVPTRNGGGPPQPGEIVIVVHPGRPPGLKIDAVFPQQPAEAVFELVATAELVDAFGNRATVQEMVWSHALLTAATEPALDDLMSWGAALAGVPAARLISASRLEERPQASYPDTDSFARRARMLRLYAWRAAADGQLDVGELQRIAKLAELVKSR